MATYYDAIKKAKAMQDGKLTDGDILQMYRQNFERDARPAQRKDGKPGNWHPSRKVIKRFIYKVNKALKRKRRKFIRNCT